MRWAATLLLLLWGCSSPTELVLVIDTNLEVPDELDRVDVAIAGPDGVQTVTPQPLDTPDAPSFPLTLGVAPGDGAGLGPLQITATGLSNDAPVVRQDAEVTLVSGQTSTLRLLLLRSCVDRDCGAQTCSELGCVDTARGELGEWPGSPEPLPDDPCLAMPWDVDGDGQGSDACGGLDCNDAEPTTASNLDEACTDAVDNDCDGAVDEDCTGCRDGEREACATPCMGVGERVCSPDGWGPCEADVDLCNYLDDDCDGLVDEGQAYQASAPVALTDAGVQARHPHLVWADDRFFVVWDEKASGAGNVFPTTVRLAALAPDGTPMAPAQSLHMPGRLPRVARGGGALGVVFVGCELDPTCTGVRAIVIGPGGMVPVTQQLDNNNDGQPRPRIAWTGSGFAVSIRDTANLAEAYFLSPDGALMGAEQSFTTPGRPDLTIVDGTLLLAFYEGTNLLVRRGTAAGFAGANTTVLSGMRYGPTAIATVSGGSVLAWSGEDDPTVGVVALDATDAPVGAAVDLSSSRAPVRDGDVDHTQPGMATAPGQVLVTWAEDGGGADAPHFARLSEAGAVLEPSAPLAASTANAGGVVAAWSGDGFGVVWSEVQNQRNASVSFARLGCPATTP